MNALRNRNRCNKRLRLLTKIIFQLGIEIIVLVCAGKSFFSFIIINYWEEFVFVRSSATKRFLFVMGGECYFNVGSAFFFLMNVGSVLVYWECFFFFLGGRGIFLLFFFKKNVR